MPRVKLNTLQEADSCYCGHGPSVITPMHRLLNLGVVAIDTNPLGEGFAADVTTTGGILINVTTRNPQNYGLPAQLLARKQARGSVNAHDRLIDRTRK